MQKAIKQVSVTKVVDGEGFDKTDALAIEEPLEIRLEFGPAGERQVQNVSVTMRTPGNDAELAAGFLFTEGIVKAANDIAGVDYCFIACAENKENVIQVSLREGVIPHLQHTGRNFYTTSSCGVCGKGSINAIRTVSSFSAHTDDITTTSNLIYLLPDILFN